jgi:hypothetical protein
VGEVVEGVSSPTEQLMTLKDGRTLDFAEYGDPRGEPVVEFHGCPLCHLEARKSDEKADELKISRLVDRYSNADWQSGLGMGYSL